VIHREAGPVPSSLDGPQSAGGLERANAIGFYRRVANRGESYAFAAYKGSDVAEGLKQVFGGKCAYCESPYEVTQPVDIEHYRPKGAVEVEGRLQKPGYYWLAADWTNLLPSCIDCNRKRTHEFPEIGPDLRGKANLFPIANPTDRATRPGQEAREQRLLLHPCMDRPEDHLEFIAEGVVRAKEIRQGVDSQMGEVSIRVYGLDRTALTKARGDRLKKIEGVIGKIRRLQTQLAQPGIAADFARFVEESLSVEMAELKSYMDPAVPYTGMARQAIAQFLREIGIPNP
jgi:uncharacterized protein (TIGR02646 family)